MSASGASDRVAVVSGGARGIGAAIARNLAAAGTSVAIVDLDPGAHDVAAAIVSEGGRSFAVTANVTDAAAVGSAFAQIVEALGPPTILVNNAGVTRDNLLFKMTEPDWDTVMAVHLKGSFLMSRAAQAFMVDAQWGRIVNLSSTSAHGNRGQANYATAKAGLIGFTRTLAIELGRYGVTCNAVAPGFIDTVMLRDTATRMGLSFEEYSQQASPSIPVRRIGTPDDVAAVVGFLVGESASYVSGEVIHIGGGFVG